MFKKTLIAGVAIFATLGLASCGGATTSEEEPSFEPTTFVPVESFYGVIGSFEGSGWADDVELVKDPTNSYAFKATISFKENDEWKIRQDHDWGSNWNYQKLDMTNSSEEALEKLVDQSENAEADNIKMQSDATLVIEFHPFCGTYDQDVSNFIVIKLAK